MSIARRRVTMRPGLIVILAICFTLGGYAQESQSAATCNSEPNYDPSKWFALMLGAQAGGGFDYHQTPPAQATVKLGSGPLTLDFGYDRLAGRNGFSTELSGMLPVVRFPSPKKNEKRLYVRLYAEPGVGYRAGGGPFGGYSSAKVMLALMSDHWLYTGS